MADFHTKLDSINTPGLGRVGKTAATLDAAANVPSPGPTDLGDLRIPDPGTTFAISHAVDTLVQGGVDSTALDPTALDTISAALRQSNTIGSLLTENRLPDADADKTAVTPDEVYSAASKDGMLAHLNSFAGVETRGEYLRTKAAIEQELADRAVLGAAGGWGMLAEFGAAVADPVNFVPLGGAAARVGRLASRGSRAALEAAFVGGTSAAAAEAVLQSSQELRTAGETGAAIAASSLFGAVLGKSVDAVFGRAISDKVSARYDEAFRNPTPTPGSAGAAAVRDLPEWKDNTVYGNGDRVFDGGAQKTLEWVGDNVSSWLAAPARDLARSESGAARDAVARLINDPVIRDKYVNGEAAHRNAEQLFAEVKGGWANARHEVNKLFRQNRKAYKSREEFNTSVARALADGDVGADDAVTAAAKHYRDGVFEPIRKSLVESGVFTKDESELLNARSYFPVVYDSQAVIGDEAMFKEYHVEQFSAYLTDQAQKALDAKLNRRQEIEAATVETKGVVQRVPKVDEARNPVINPKTGKQVIETKVLEAGSLREAKKALTDEFKATVKEYRAERDTVLKAFADETKSSAELGREAVLEFGEAFKARDALIAEKVKVRDDLQAAIEQAKQVRDTAVDATKREAAGIAPRLEKTRQARKLGKEEQRAVDKAISDYEAHVRELRSKATDQTGKIDTKIAKEAEKIKAYYADAIRDYEVEIRTTMEAKTDEAVARIAAAREITLDEGYTGLLKSIVRGDKVDPQLVAVEAQKRTDQLYAAITRAGRYATDTHFNVGTPGYRKMRKNPSRHVELMDRRWVLSDVERVAEVYTNTAGTDAALSRIFKQVVAKTDEDGNILRDADGKAEMIEVGDPSLRQVKKSIQKYWREREENIVVPPEVVDKIRRKYADNPKAAEDALKRAKVEETKRIKELATRDTQSIDTLLNFMKGTSGTSVGGERLRTVSEGAGIVNYILRLGGTVLSSLGDPINLIISQRLGNTIRHGIVPMLTDFDAAWRNADGPARRLSRLALANVEMEMNTHALEIGGLVSPWSEGKTIEKLRKMAAMFSTASGIQFWNTLWKQVSYNVVQARIVELATVASKATNGDMIWMRSLGISDDMLPRIAAAYEGQNVRTLKGGMPIADWESWADDGAAEAFRAATYAESFNVVITPGHFDRLNAHSHPVGRNLLQFRSFMLGAQSRLLGRNVALAAQDSSRLGSAFTGLVGLVMMGALIDGMKQIMSQSDATGEGVAGAVAGGAAGRVAGGLPGAATGFVVGAGIGQVIGDGRTLEGDSKRSEFIEGWKNRPAQSLYNALDRVGIMPIIFEGSNIVSKTAGTGIQDAARLLAGEDKGQTSRTYYQDWLHTIAGPTAGLASDVQKTFTAFRDAAFDDDRDLTPGELRKASRLVPGASIPYIRPFINEGAKRIGTPFDPPF